MTVQSWWQLADRTQPILNARRVPPRRAQRRLTPPVPVVATIEWEIDGPEQLHTVATRWTSAGDVLVEINDLRRATLGVWLRRGDVVRREPGAARTGRPPG
ncbi:hypothetical protein LQF12_02075 [Ruania suaedae]|uniref:hypothetical protein n=1 Tax=Ruania suaedae TaxID=2897774 RepID=UPI001E519CD6|nr:hypothetical protein [Ruania suaedae]UFU03419.1 hypothetical protein LQF12_02075 [Ruania suaedae]